MSVISPPVISYHSVAPELFDDWVLWFLTHRLRYFEAHLAYLQHHGFRSILLGEWLAIRQGEQASDGREICLTFDDGLLDNWVYVFPVARKYGFSFTIFVAPEWIDPRGIVRPTLEDVWNGNCRPEELNANGFLSWKELRIMEESGWVDVQSHTMTHDKHIASSRIEHFYYGGFPGFYATINATPGIKPYYRADPDFERLLSWGIPLFEEKSAVITKKHTINPDFLSEAKQVAKSFDLSAVPQRTQYEEKVRALHAVYEQQDKLLESVETEDEFQARLDYEIAGSKAAIEAKLGKEVRFLCWPHNDNSHLVHSLARSAGYMATTSGRLTSEAGKPDRIPRIGAPWGLPVFLNRQKLHYKIRSHYRQQPYYALWLANELKNRLLGRV